jgi:prepilin-type N-terminal cleavage/methylation domain-containing protein
VVNQRVVDGESQLRYRDFTFSPIKAYTKDMKTSRSGFTLIELLVVIAIIGILAALVLISVSTARSKARDAQRKTDMREVKIALEVYKAANNGKYPSTGGAWWSSEPGSAWYPGADYIPGLSPTYYSATLPRDPAPDAAEAIPACILAYRTYIYRSDGDTYKLLAHCTPENINASDPFIDPVRPTFSWMVCSGEPACSGW